MFINERLRIKAILKQMFITFNIGLIQQQMLILINMHMHVLISLIKTRPLRPSYLKRSQTHLNKRNYAVESNFKDEASSYCPLTPGCVGWVWVCPFPQRHVGQGEGCPLPLGYVNWGGGCPLPLEMLVGDVPYLQDELVRVGDVPATVVYEPPYMTGQLYGKCLYCLPFLVLYQSEISTCFCTLIY